MSMFKQKTLDLSPERKAYLKRQKREKISVFAIQWSILIAFFALWEAAARLGWIDSFLTSQPSRMWQTLKSLYQDGQIFVHVGVTCLETVIGFLLGTVLGTFIAVLLWWSPFLNRVMQPYLIVLNSLPKIALGPVIIIWFGAGTKPIVVMAILICIVITIINMLSAFLSCDKDKILLLRSMGANRFQLLFKLILPHSLPAFLSVLKINVGLSWVGTIMGEYLVSKAGLGYLIVYGGQVFKLDLVMASTVILCLLAALMYFFVGLFERFLKRRSE